MYDALLIRLEKDRIPTNVSMSYTFDFGPKELVNMVGIPQKDASFVLRKLMENKMIQVVKDKIYAVDVVEITKQTEFYRKMQKIAKAREASARV
jgi:transcription initiation factor IIE alpha subunit